MTLSVNVKSIFDARYQDVSDNVPIQGTADAAVLADGSIGPEKLSPGSNSQILTTVSGVPAWAAAGASGAGVTVGTLASRPVASNNALYYATDARPNFPTANGKGVLYVGNGSSWQSVSRSEEETLGWFNVMDHGFVADANRSGGWTDNTSMWTTLMGLADANKGMVIYFPRASSAAGGGYYTATGFTSTIPGLTIMGEGPAGASVGLGNGPTVIYAGDGAWAFDLGNAAVGHFKGYRLEDFAVTERNASQALGGIIIRRTSDNTIQNVTCSNFRAGKGFSLDGTGGFSQYSTFYNLYIGPCLYGYHQKIAGGTKFFSGTLDGTDNTGGTGVIVSNSIGAWIESGSEFFLFGTQIDGYDTLVDIGSGGGGDLSRLNSLRCEVWKTAAVRIRSPINGCQVSATGDNSLYSSHNGGIQGIGVQIDSGATNTDCTGSMFLNCAAEISDSGTGTITPRRPFVQKAGVVGDGDYLRSPYDGALAVDTTNKHLQIRSGGAWNYVSGNGTLLPIISRVRGFTNVGGSTGQTTVTLTVPTGGVATGHHLIVLTTFGVPTSLPTVTVTDSQSNTYQSDIVVGTASGQAPGCSISSSHITTPLAAGDTVTVTYGTAISYPTAGAYEYANIASASWVDGTPVGTTGTSTAADSGGVTTTAGSTLVIGVLTTITGVTLSAIGSGFSTFDRLTGLGLKTFNSMGQVDFATGTYNATATLSSSTAWAAAVAAYKSA